MRSPFRRWLLALSTFLFLPSTSADSILKLEETDATGRKYALDGELSIVDINSTIHVDLDREALRVKVSKALGSNGNLGALAEDAHHLLALSERGLAVLPKLQEGLRAWREESAGPSDIEALSRALQPAAEILSSILSFALAGESEAARAFDARLNQALEDAPRLPEAAQYELVFRTAAELASGLNAQLARTLEEEGVYVQLGAWRSSRSEDVPIHLPGFDEYPVGERFVVDRFQLVPTTEQQQQMADLSNKAKEVNEKGLQSVLDLGAELRGLAAPLTEAAGGCLMDLRNRVDAARADARGAVADAADRVSFTSTELRGMLLGLKARVDFPAGGAERALLDFQEDAARTVTLSRDLRSALEALRARIGEAAVGTAGKLPEIRDLLSSCGEQLQGATEMLLQNLRGVVGLVLAGSTISDRVREFSQEVLKHGLDAVPDETDLEIPRTGRRSQGELIEIRLAAGRETTEGGRKVLETRRLRIDRTLLYSILHVGVIFADPSGSLPSQSKYHTAPSYSIIFKKDSRHSIVYNSLFSPGVGVNFAVLDFNGDESPEVGVGFVLSTLREFFQIGYGYDITEDRSYHFFGVRIPFSSKEVSLQGGDAGGGS